MKKKIIKNSKEPEIKRTTKDESRGVVPPSAAEQLEKVKLILAMNGYPVVDLIPQQRERMGAGYSKPEKYTSPLEFSINGIVFGLYGSRLTVDGEPEKSSVNVYDIKETYKIIERISKSRGTNAPLTKPVAKIVPVQILSRYLTACVGV